MTLLMLASRAAHTPQHPTTSQAPPSALPNCLLVVGFHPDETAALQQHIRATHPDWHVAPILHADLQHDITHFLQQCASGAPQPAHKEADVVLGVGRVVLCSGQGVLQRLFDVQMLMEDDENDEVPPPMFGVVEDGDAQGTVGQRLEAVRTAFGQVHGLVVPLGGGGVEDPDLDERLGMLFGSVAVVWMWGCNGMYRCGGAMACMRTCSLVL